MYEYQIFKKIKFLAEFCVFGTTVQRRGSEKLLTRKSIMHAKFVNSRNVELFLIDFF